MAESADDVDDFLGSGPQAAVASPVPDAGDVDSFLGPGPSGPQAASPPTSPLRVPKMLGQAAAEAAQNVLGLPGVVGELIAGKMPPGRNALERNLTKIHNALTLPTGSEIANTTGLGLSQHPELAPQTLGEKAAVTGVEGAVGALLLMASGVGPLAALAGSEVPSFASAGAKEAGAPPWLTNTIGIVSALGTAGGSGVLERLAAARAAASQFKRAGDTLALAQEAQTSGNALTTVSSDAAKALSEAKLAGAKGLAASSLALADSQAAAATEATAKSLGTSNSLESAGNLIQPAARDWVENILPQKLAVVRDPLVAQVGAATPTPMSRLVGALGDMPKAKLATLRANLPPRLLSALDEAIASGRPLSWNGAMDLRSAIGDMAGNQKIVNALGQQQASALYAAATKDLGAGAKAAGAGDLFDAYNAEATRLYSFRDNVLGKIVSASNDLKDKIFPEAAAKNMLALAKNGGTPAAMLRTETPAIANELGATALRTGAWANLSEGAKQAFLNNPMQRAKLQIALDAQEASPGEAKALVAQQTQAHRDRLTAITADAKTATTSRANAVAFAQKKADTAAALIPPKATTILDFLTKHRLGFSGASLGGFLGGLGVHDAAPWVLSHLGLPTSPAVAAGSAAGALALPAVVSGAKIAVRNPLVPGVGLLAGENALTVPESGRPGQ